MDQRELKDMLAKLTEMVEASLPKATTDGEIKVAAFTLLGITIVGELLLDMKRIADAAERLAGDGK